MLEQEPQIKMINKQYLKIVHISHCIPEKNNTQVDTTKDLDVVLPIYNLIEYSDNYLKTSGISILQR